MLAALNGLGDQAKPMVAHSLRARTSCRSRWPVASPRLILATLRGGRSDA
jgi:hypothetical protein